MKISVLVTLFLNIGKSSVQSKDCLEVVNAFSNVGPTIVCASKSLFVKLPSEMEIESYRLQLIDTT